MNSEQPREKSLAELKDELKRLQVKLKNSDDRDIKDALQLKIDALQSKVDDLAAKLPDAPSEKEEVEEEPEGPIEPPTEEQLQQAEQFIREARVATMRGHQDQAAELLKKAAEAAPTATSVLEMQGDELVKQKKYKEARAVFKKALRIDPKNAAIERKYAEQILRTSGNLTIDEQMRMSLSESPFLNPADHIASAKAATILSVFAPGAGQFVTGQTKLGASIFFGWLFCVFFVFLMRSDVKVLLSMGGIGPQSGVSSFNGLVLIPLAIAVMLHIGSVVMMAVQAADSAKEKPKSDRPKPPVNLPFE